MWRPPFIFRTPKRLQIDPIECGAAALGIVLEAYGYWVSNRTLRNACQTSRSGSNASSIIAAAAQFSLNATPLRCLSSDVRNCRPPAILFFDHSHFVVFEGYFLKRYFINDPAVGRYQLAPEEFRRRFSNFLISLEKADGFFFSAGRSDLVSWSSIDASAKMSFMVLGILSALVFTFFAASVGLVLRTGGKGLKIESEWLNALLVLLVLVMVVGIWLLWQNIRRSWIRLSRIRAASLIDRLRSLPFGFFDEIPFSVVSKNIGRLVDEALSTVMSSLSGYFFLSFAFFLTIFIFLVSWVIGSILLIVLLVSLTEQGITSFLAINDRPSGCATTLNRFFLPLFDMRAMGQLQFSLKGLLSSEITHLTLPSLRLYHHFVVAALTFLCFLQAVFEWHLKKLSLNEIFATTILIAGFLIAIGLRSRLFAFRDGAESKALFLEMTSPTSSFQCSQAKSDLLLELKSVSFSYRGESQEILRDVNLSIGKGEIIGVVGTPQSGKTTLLRMLANKIAPKNGEVIHHCIHQNGLSIASLDQDADVMEASLRDNVTLFNPRISEHAIFNALKASCALDLFYNRPYGLLTKIEAHGKNLSSSEKKRLILAQAVAHQADLFVLDDFFSSLDQSTSQAILTNLRTMMSTVVFTSFQENELERTTRVVFLSDRLFLTIDSHTNLFNKYELYRALITERK